MRLYPFSLLVLLAATGCVLEPIANDPNVPTTDPDVNNPFDPAAQDPENNAGSGSTGAPASSGNDPFQPASSSAPPGDTDSGWEPEDEDEDEDEDEEDDD